MFSFDPSILHFINGWVGVSSRFDTLLVWLVDANFVKGAPMVLGLWWCWYRPPADDNRRFVITAILGVLLAIIASSAFQLVGPVSPRPLHNPALLLTLPAGVRPTALKDMSSFPSDHAAMFGAFAAVWFRRSFWAGCCALAWALLVICFPRVYLGFHYPSDIAAGLVVGLGSVWTAFRFQPVTWAAGQVLRIERWTPALFYPVFFLFTAQLSVMFIDIRNAMSVLHGIVFK